MRFYLDLVMANFEAAGFCGVLAKPYGMANVAEVINRILKLR
jgi:hypothetical protein